MKAHTYHTHSALGWISPEAALTNRFEQKKVVWEVTPGITSRGEGREENLNRVFSGLVTATGNWESTSGTTLGEDAEPTAE